MGAFNISRNRNLLLNTKTKTKINIKFWSKKQSSFHTQMLGNILTVGSSFTVWMFTMGHIVNYWIKPLELECHFRSVVMDSGSRGTTAHVHQCCSFQSYAKTVPSRMKLNMKLTMREPASMTTDAWSRRVTSDLYSANAKRCLSDMNTSYPVLWQGANGGLNPLALLHLLAHHVAEVGEDLGLPLAALLLVERRQRSLLVGTVDLVFLSQTHGLHSSMPGEHKTADR